TGPCCMGPWHCGAGEQMRKKGERKINIDRLLSSSRERLRELRALNAVSAILNRCERLDQGLQEVCDVIPPAWRFPSVTVARITYRGREYKSSNFRESAWGQCQSFGSALLGQGRIEVYYLDRRPTADEGPFLREERNLLVNLAGLLSGKAAETAYDELLVQNRERVKELRGLNRITAVLNQDKPVPQLLQLICDALPDAWQYPADTVARIIYEDITCTTRQFRETPWVQQQTFVVPPNRAGSIEVFYLTQFPEEAEGPFLKEERDLLNNLAELISGRLTKQLHSDIVASNAERLKELSAINRTTAIIQRGTSVGEALQQIASLLPDSWQYPQHAVARVAFGDKVYVSRSFEETRWFQRETYTTVDNRRGVVEVFYLEEMPEAGEGPFLVEERNLLRNVAQLIAHYINNAERRGVMVHETRSDQGAESAHAYRESLISATTPLQQFFNRQIVDKYVYLDMMRHKVREILFVATLYDASVLEVEDSFFEHFMGEMFPYSLYSLPRITGVMSGDEAMKALERMSFDLVVLMTGIDKEETAGLSARIKAKLPSLPVYLLANRREHVGFFMDWMARTGMADKLFVWSGSSDVFFAIVKSMEDMWNVDADTNLALVGVILFVEDAPEHYSKYLTILYSILFELIQRVSSAHARNDLDRISKMRSRPKVLHVRNYEDATSLYNRYREHILAVICDAEFERNGQVDTTAGIELARYVRGDNPTLPYLLQSSHSAYAQQAEHLRVAFVDKNARELHATLRRFIEESLGFGDFIVTDTAGRPFDKADGIQTLRSAVARAPVESLVHHVKHNHFSRWLMARGAIKAAKRISALRGESAADGERVRSLIAEALDQHLDEQMRGKVLPYRSASDFSEKTIVVLAGGSFGGKGRGVAFLNTLVHNAVFASHVANVKIRTPTTAIIGTDEFERFLSACDMPLTDVLGLPYDELRGLFLRTELSADVLEGLEAFVSSMRGPIAVRSSSLLEDSASQPFSGVFHTYLLPNNHPDVAVRLRQLCDAVRLVYSSLYTPEAREYCRVVGRHIEDERMAVILQELIGARREHYYYPHISGVARSLNYYPVSYMKPEEGYCSLAIGLGTYVVEGNRSHGFCPRYPAVQFGSIKEQLENSQRFFYALDLDRSDVDIARGGENAALATLELSEAEKHGTLKHCVSVYDPESDRVLPGLTRNGPRIVDFADILRHGYTSLAQSVDALLGTAREAFGSPVEMELAVTLPEGNEPSASLYLLQIKPVAAETSGQAIELKEGDTKDTLVYSQTCLGNGHITGVHDVIVVDPRSFDKLRTEEIAREVAYLNMKLTGKGLGYVLIGPGRWGTRDRNVGVPVMWSQIAGAKVIVEAGLAGFSVEASLGSHFFHNLTSMKVGYFAVEHGSLSASIRWDTLYELEPVETTPFCMHVHFDSPLDIRMDGRARTGIIVRT
ncbi:MAG: hypothetical protein GF331_17355, partial [Chitinivibrionales bacterium]|nr:hypothetical protein [Chitinivibrionales bacterium]